MNYHYNNPRMNRTSMMFTNYPGFLEDLKKAIKDERQTIILYKKLYEAAPTETAKYSIKTALKDEKVHNKKLTELYKKLTGYEPDIQLEEVDFYHFYDVLRKAFLDEVKAFEFYKEMYLSTKCPGIRDLLYNIQHDEMEHAALFNWVHAEIK